MKHREPLDFHIQKLLKQERGQNVVTEGFGVPAISHAHHFKVRIPKSRTEKVKIIEYLGKQVGSQEESTIHRAWLDWSHWSAIQDKMQRVFNSRLQAYGLSAYQWKVGENPVDRLLGKELCVLMWAIELLDLDRVPAAFRNWLALRPEDRWWLFDVTAATSGGVKDTNKGWRVALYYALGDMKRSDQPKMLTDGRARAFGDRKLSNSRSDLDVLS